jgi:hypothetical protein
MGEFSDTHNTTLYYRAPTANETGSESFGDPGSYGSPVAFKAAVDWVDERTGVPDGIDRLRPGKLQTHTEIKFDYLIFPPGDDGSDVSTGRHPRKVHTAQLSNIGPTGVLCEVEM